MSQEHRKLRFESLDQAIDEIERLAGGSVRTTGSFSFGQILEHLARTLEIVTGTRQPPKASLPMKVLSRLVKPMVLKKATTGFKLPSNAQSVLWPSEDVSVEDGLNHLRSAFAQFRSTDPLPPHVFFGKMTRPQHEQLQCRHFEGHLGFVHPA